MFTKHSPKSHEIILRSLGRASLAVVAAGVFGYWAWNPQEPPPIEDQDGLIEPKQPAHEDRAVDQDDQTLLMQRDPAAIAAQEPWAVYSATANARQEAADLQASSSTEPIASEDRHILTAVVDIASEATGAPQPRAPP